jgi:hypothetical protein
VGKQFVFRTRGDKSIMAARPTFSGASGSESQQEVRFKFKLAVIYAKKAMANPELADAYAARIRGNQSAFNVAFKDAYYGPELSKLRTEGYTGQPGQPILVQAVDNFRVTLVKVKIFAADGQLLEEGQAVEDENGYDWLYTTKLANPAVTGSRIQVTAEDLPKNSSLLEATL